MAKLPKFLIGANEAARPNQLYVTHTQVPFFVAEVIPMEGVQLTASQLSELYKIGGRTEYIGKYYFVINVVIMFDSKQYANNQESADYYAKLMSRTCDWVYNYLKTNQNE